MTRVWRWGLAPSSVYWDPKSRLDFFTLCPGRVSVTGLDPFVLPISLQRRQVHTHMDHPASTSDGCFSSEWGPQAVDYVYGWDFCSPHLSHTAASRKPRGSSTAEISRAAFFLKRNRRSISNRRLPPYSCPRSRTKLKRRSRPPRFVGCR